MQIKVLASPTAPAYNLTKLTQAFAKNVGKRGVFEASQPKIIVPQAAYNSAYNKTFTTNVGEEYIQLFENTHTFKNISGTSITIPMEPKSIQDGMNVAYEPEYGRGSNFLGLVAKNATPLTTNSMQKTQ
jgi:hypothetical protein